MLWIFLIYSNRSSWVVFRRSKHQKRWILLRISIWFMDQKMSTNHRFVWVSDFSGHDFQNLKVFSSFNVNFRFAFHPKSNWIYGEPFVRTAPCGHDLFTSRRRDGKPSSLCDIASVFNENFWNEREWWICRLFIITKSITDLIFVVYRERKAKNSRSPDIYTERMFVMYIMVLGKVSAKSSQLKDSMWISVRCNWFGLMIRLWAAAYVQQVPKWIKCWRMH